MTFDLLGALEFSVQQQEEIEAKETARTGILSGGFLRVSFKHLRELIARVRTAEAERDAYRTQRDELLKALGDCQKCPCSGGET